MPSRRRRADPDEQDPELASYLAAPSPDDTGGFGSAQVLLPLVPAPRLEHLRWIAGKRGVSPGPLTPRPADRPARRRGHPDRRPLAVVAQAEKRRRGP